MNEVWTIAEQRGGTLADVSFELLARGRKLADAARTGLLSVVLGPAMPAAELRELVERGADRVIHIADPALADFVCETYSGALAELAGERRPQIILAAATTSGRTLMPHLAVKLGAGLTADCTELEIEEATGLLLQTRPAIGGNIMATIKTPDRKPQMATVRPKSAKAPDRDSCREGVVETRSLPPAAVERRVRVLGMETKGLNFQNIEDAEIVIAGGRGLKKADNFNVVRALAESLGGVIGASREAVDRGWISYPHQVGLSGKTVSPKLYLCAGVSGAIQHLAGIKTAKTIVSINSDPEAPIHRVADFAIVGDLFAVLPLLSSRIARLRASRRGAAGAAPASCPDGQEDARPVAPEASKGDRA